MKKIILSVLIALVVVITSNICVANRFDNNPNYYYATTGGGSAIYINLKSIDVQEYNPPHYQIACTLTIINTRSDEYNEIYRVVRYNWYTKESFTLRRNGEWTKNNPNATSAERHDVIIAQALFRATYGMNFYGD